MPAESTPPELPPSARTRIDRPRAPRLPGSYAGSYERDMDWRRGVTVLWLLFGAAAVCEVVYAAIYYLQGGIGYPGFLEGARLVVEAALFLALWLGWGWLRWPLAALNFAHAGWLIVWLIASHAANPDAPVGTPPPVWGVASIPILATAGVYLVSAAYLAFSADVLDFLRHRREEGRGWVVAPLIILAGVFLLGIFGSQWIFLGWLSHEKASALDFVTTVLPGMTTPWNKAAYEAQADPAFLATWYAGDRQRVFEGLAPLGAFQHAGQTEASAGTHGDDTGGGYEVDADVSLGEARFAHGTTRFSIELSRTLFGSWKLRGFEAPDIKRGTNTGQAAPTSER